MKHEHMDTWPMELRAIAENLEREHPPSYPGEAHPIDLLREIASWFEGDAEQEAIVQKLREKVYALTSLAGESFDSWYRIQFGSQARVDPDVKLGYLDGYRDAESKKKEPVDIEIVFDGPPGPVAGRFVEVEAGGTSVKMGEWVDRGDGYWVLRLKAIKPKPPAVRGFGTGL